MSHPSHRHLIALECGPQCPRLLVMLTRLIFAILIAMAVVPMSTATVCHAAPAPAPAMHHGSTHHESGKAIPVENYCIGCVTPESLGGPKVAPPAPPPPPAKLPLVASTGAARPKAAPGTPPPRSGT